MKQLFSLLALTSLLGCTATPNPDPNRKTEVVISENSVVESCVSRNLTKSVNERKSNCDKEFFEKFGYSREEARESLKKRTVPL